jgi:phosphatidylglycerol lysyltransferase
MFRPKKIPTNNLCLIPLKDSIDPCRLGAASCRRPQSRVIRYTIGVTATRREIGFNSEQLRHARELVLRYGWNATAYQIINPGIELWFSSICEAVVGFVRARNTLVVAGAPICARERLADVAAEFERAAMRDGRRVCYFGAEARLEALYRGATTHSMVLLGAQPTWRPLNWLKIISHRASLRAQLNRARNKSVSVSEWPSEQAAGHTALQDCLQGWLATRGLPPMHFLVEPQTLERLVDRRVFVAELNGQVVGFLVASPVPLRNGWLIEQIIRGRGAPNGTAELMIDAAVRAMAEEDSEYMTLGLSPLSRRATISRDGNPLWLRWLLSWAQAHGRRFYNFDGLDAFKTKFHPDRWEPVFAIFNAPHFSPVALYAIAEAFTKGAPIRTVAGALLKAAQTEVGWFADRFRVTDKQNA